MVYRYRTLGTKKSPFNEKKYPSPFSFARASFKMHPTPSSYKTFSAVSFIRASVSVHFITNAIIIVNAIIVNRSFVGMIQY